MNNKSNHPVNLKTIILVFFIVLVLFLLFVFRYSAPADEDTSTQLIVTEVYNVIGEEVIITRVIELTPTPTPVPTDIPIEERGPIVLDIAFNRSTPPRIDPQQNLTQDGIDLIENLFVGLTRYNHQTNKVEPALANSWEVSDNGRVWTFHLRDDISWVRPGEPDAMGLYTAVPVRPVVAADVVAAVHRVCQQHPNTPEAFNLFIIEACEQVNSTANATDADLQYIGVRALNDTTVQFTLVKPAAYFLTLTSMWYLRPLPPEMFLEELELDEGTVFVENSEWQDETELEWMTSGPFFPLSPELTTLQRNPLWPLARTGNVQQVNIHYANSSEQSDLWLDRQLDIIDTTASAIDESNDRMLARMQWVPQQTVYYIGFNFNSGVFREANVRRAFAAAIDREKLVEELFGESGAGMRHLIPPDVIGSSPIDQIGVGYSPDYARQQLASSGFGHCGLMPPITFLISTSDLSLRQAEIIQKMWIDELGCTAAQINIEQVQFGTLLANIHPDAGERRPDVWELAWASYYPDAHNWMADLLHCDDSTNHQNRPCSEEDDLIRQANLTFDADGRTTFYRQLENHFFSETGIMPLAPLYLRSELRLPQNWLTYTPATFGGEQFDTYLIDAQRKELERSR